MQAGKPFLGICLGMQLLFEGSEENNGVEGLGIIPGGVTRFDASLGLPVPHIGWNDLDQRWAAPVAGSASAWPCLDATACSAVATADSPACMQQHVLHVATRCWDT